MKKLMMIALLTVAVIGGYNIGGFAQNSEYRDSIVRQEIELHQLKEYPKEPRQSNEYPEKRWEYQFPKEPRQSNEYPEKRWEYQYTKKPRRPNEYPEKRWEYQFPKEPRQSNEYLEKRWEYEYPKEPRLSCSHKT